LISSYVFVRRIPYRSQNSAIENALLSRALVVEVVGAGLGLSLFIVTILAVAMRDN
jgi:hypothetical protein